MASYFDLKKKLSSGETTKSSSSGSSYFKLKEKLASSIEANRAREEELKRKKQKEENLKSVQEQAAKYAEEAKKASSFGGMTKAFLGELGKNLIQTPAKFVTSAADVGVRSAQGQYAAAKAALAGKGLMGAAEAQRQAYTGGGIPQYNLFGMKSIPVSTYTEDAKKIADDIIEGRAGLGAMAWKMAEVPLAGMETVGLGKGLFSVGKGLNAGLPAKEIGKELWSAFMPSTRSVTATDEAISALKKPKLSATEQVLEATGFTRRKLGAAPEGMTVDKFGRRMPKVEGGIEPPAPGVRGAVKAEPKLLGTPRGYATGEGFTMSPSKTPEALLEDISRAVPETPPKEMFHGTAGNFLKVDRFGNINLGKASGDVEQFGKPVKIDTSNMKVYPVKTADELFDIAADPKKKQMLLDDGYDIISGPDQAMAINAKKISEATGIPLREAETATMGDLVGKRAAKKMGGALEEAPVKPAKAVKVSAKEAKSQPLQEGAKATTKVAATAPKIVKPVAPKGKYAGDIEKARAEQDDLIKQEIQFMEDLRDQSRGVETVYAEPRYGGAPEVSRHSLNPQWYREFYKIHKRAPKKSEMFDIAKEELERGRGMLSEEYKALNDVIDEVSEANKMKVSGIAKEINKKFDKEGIAKAIDEGELPGYNASTVKTQDEKISDILTNDIDRFKRLLSGAETDDTLKGGMLVKYAEEYIKKTGDEEMIDLIRKSPLLGEGSEAGSELRFFAERNPNSPSAMIQGIRKALEDAIVPKLKGKSVQAVKKAIAEDIQSKLEKGSFDSFIDSIKC